MALINDKLLDELLDFRTERDWQQFHTSRNIAASITIEAAELLECFQWASDADLPMIVERDREAIEDEVADLTILLSYLCTDLRIDIDAVVERKLQKNAEKYPAHLARGTATKYDKL
jgi:NTP pyrophosphatase (non-canonical NTP hydrolase)